MNDESKPYPGLRALVARAAGGDHRATDRAMDLRPCRLADDAIQAALGLPEGDHREAVLAAADEQLACLRAAAAGVAGALKFARPKGPAGPGPGSGPERRGPAQ